MNTDRSCGCKSFRSCYICEEQFGLKTTEPAKERVEQYDKHYSLCPESNRLSLDDRDKPDDEKEIIFPGVQIIRDFVTQEEEEQLIKDLDLLPWDASQSGRRKQNFGPKANFKKRKTKVGDFCGFPSSTKFIQDRFSTVPSLEDYRPVEQCSIEYRPETGACIEPHIDDCWIWGERIVQLNLLSDSVLTCLPYHGDKTNKYNLPDVQTYPRVLSEDGRTVLLNPFQDKFHSDPYLLKENHLLDAVVRIPLPRRSLLVFYGEPRYDWEHCILRKDISDRRIVIAYRELTPLYLKGGKEEERGREILAAAKQFWEG